jgi:hypothetical protein
MNARKIITSDRAILVSQIVSVSLIWIFVIGIGIWVVNLLLLSLDLHDVPSASVGISMVAIPVFLMLASVLTYVFVGLQRENWRLSHRPDVGSKED